MEAQCYIVRHLKRGLLTDRIFLEEPSEEELVAMCGADDVEAGLVRVVTSKVHSCQEILQEYLDPVPEPEPVQDKPIIDRVFKLVAGGVGTVTPPK